MSHSRRSPAPATDPTSPPHCADPRARILDALIATVAYRGYDRTTVERVLQTADVPGAVFDEHFQN
jgi:AcrR family transcriptional regulator